MGLVNEGRRSPPGAGARVRRAYEPDWEAYRDLRLRALATDSLAFGSTLARERDFPPERWKGRLGRPGDPGPSASWVAVGSKGTFVGMIVCGVFEDEPHLFAMWVDPAQRRKGIASRLLDRALAWASAGFPDLRVVLEVNPRQTEAVRLYESRGFRPTGRASTLVHAPDERIVEMALEPHRTRGGRPGSGRPAGLNSGRQA